MTLHRWAGLLLSWPLLVPNRKGFHSVSRLSPAHANMIYSWPSTGHCFLWRELGRHVSMHLDRQVRRGLGPSCHCRFSSNRQLWVGFVSPVHISCKSTSTTCPRSRPSQTTARIPERESFGRTVSRAVQYSKCTSSRPRQMPFKASSASAAG